MAKTFLVLIPAYNAGSTISELIEKTSEFVDKSDILVIDDGSKDQTFALAQRAGVVVLKHETNEGKGEALKTGFKYAQNKNYEALFTIDADLQHDPSSIRDFLQKANQNFSGIIIGTREINLKKMPLARWLTNNLCSAILSILSGQRIRDSQSGYRLISTQVLKRLKLKAKKYDLESEILVKAGRSGFKIDSVPIRTIYRGSKSFINPFVDTGRFIKLMWRTLWW
ncbi:MAG: glycosyltransferase family 2 protein [candidate division Zixibacteria bacterium]|nr:glycosyltransferase family 2 protein [candidate division Zixibacteria bacterium]MCK4428436.1 glycosyltransferase family 2 protein [candidate division Zixibacteria bacterium]